jgi:three-Cys-motif partner protein
MMAMGSGERTMVSTGKEIQPWSKEKLLLLEKYLKAYSVIMQKQKASWLRAYSYVDAFAGVGQYADRETEKYVDGSPVVALKCEPPFDEYRFIEFSPNRLDYLRRQVQAQFPSRHVQFHAGDANIILRESVAAEITRSRLRRGFVFLDPYGLQVDFATVEQLASTRTFDVFVNFSVMGINRVLRRREMPDDRTLALLARVMGDTAWVESLYARQGTLFGEGNHVSRARLSPSQVADQYIGHMEGLFRYVSEPVLMRNSRRAPLYVLFLASHNETAVKITNHIFRQHERWRTHPST